MCFYTRSPSLGLYKISYIEAKKEKQKVEAKIEKMRNSNSCFGAKRDCTEKLDHYLASRDKMEEVWAAITLDHNDLYFHRYFKKTKQVREWIN